VNQASSTSRISCAPKSLAVGSPRSIKCIAKVTGYKPTWIGSPETSVTFSTSGTGSVTLGSATCTTPKGNRFSCSVTMTGTTAGQIGITASYVGDGNNTGSTSNSTSFTIKPVKTKLSLSCTASSVGVGSGVTCTATLTGYYGSVAGETISWSQLSGKGSVSFPSPPTCSLSSAGTCSITVTGASPGSVKIEAVYSGDTNNVGSSKTVSLKVT
jgi:hypothetical protein